jgi:hypothetical protein
LTQTAARSSLSAFWDRYAFTVGDIDLLWIDVAIGAMARGEWAAFERRLAEGLAAAARAAADEQEPDDEAVDELGTAFRYERDLISGEDMSAWLERAGITTEEWLAFIRRDVLRRQCVHELDDLLDRFGPSVRQLEAAAVAEGICSGLFDAFEQTLAGRVALAFEADAQVFDARRATSPVLEAAARALARLHPHWLTMRPELDVYARCVAMLRVEEHFRRLSERLASPDCLRTLVEGNRLDYVRLELDTVAFASESAAREGALCVTADGLSLQDVAGLARQRVRRSHVFLADAPPEQRDLLLSAEPGQVVGPFAVDGRFELSALVTRTVPRLDDDAVVARAHRVAIGLEARRAAREHVTRRS